ncbi:MAG: methylmalonyl-CoA mutase, partial [Deltaproteobacteria bacterium]|nr:methylmalonyl-CoA mutase [Deltaproteobacteria bacterium]
GSVPVVGVNCFQAEDEDLPIELFEDPETLQIQEKKLEKIMGERSASKVRQALDAIARCCDTGGNLMEVTVDSVKARVTEGEISRVIKGCYGTWNAPLF